MELLRNGISTFSIVMFVVALIYLLIPINRVLDFVN